MSDENLNTEGPTDGVSAPAGGSDPARDAAREAEGNTDAPQSTPAGSGETSAETTGEDVPADTGQKSDDAPTDPGPDGPTQEELDQMVDYTVTPETEDQFPDLPDGTPVKAGDVVKLAKDHPLLASDGADTANAEGQS